MSQAKYSEQQLRLIIDHLPYGYGTIIRKRLPKTNGKKYSIDSIYRGLMFSHQSRRIVKAAIQLTKEEGHDLNIIPQS